jgi:hypothetical protein
MGLDMFARTTTEKPASDVDFDMEQHSELHYWRKHPDLHGWMEKLYRGKGGAAESFNCVRMVLTALNQPTRIISANPRASPRSDLLSCTDNTACACRASRQTTGRPSAVSVSRL